jgi:hypothetical protein
VWVLVKSKTAMSQYRLQQIGLQIKRVKDQLLKIGEMRPGCLTRQYKNPKDKTGGFYQISYTRKMKSRTEYVRPQHVEMVRQQIKTYKRFKRLIEKWVDLCIEYARLKTELANCESQNKK